MTREEIQRTAVDLFAHKGFAATSIRQLGTAAGVNSATLYHYAAGGKEEWLATIMRTCLAELLRLGRLALVCSEDPNIQLVQLVRGHVGMTALNPLTARVTDQEMRALSADNFAELVAVRDDYESMFSTVLTRGVRTSAFQVVDARLTRLALLEMCNGVAHWYRPDGRLSVMQVADQFGELARRIVGATRKTDVDLSDNEVVPRRLATEPSSGQSDAVAATA